MNIKRIFHRCLYMPHSIYFNLHYLPLSQAIKLPILLHKPILKKMKGGIVIKSEDIKFGMIKLGGNSVSIYDSKYGIMWENMGGNLTFYGKCNLGNGASVSIGEYGNIEIGENFKATAMCKIVSYNSIKFGTNVLIGWECLFLDTDFHSLTDINTGVMKKATAPIVIGDNNWFALKSVVLKGTETPSFCTVGANTLLNKKYENSPYCMLVGNPAKLKKTNTYRDHGNDTINYKKL